MMALWICLERMRLWILFVRVWRFSSAVKEVISCVFGDPFFLDSKSLKVLKVLGSSTSFVVCRGSKRGAIISTLFEAGSFFFSVHFSVQRRILLKRIKYDSHFSLRLIFL